MGVESGLNTGIFIGIAGFFILAASQLLLYPKPKACRSANAKLIEAGLWFVLYALLLFILGRPWCALAAALAFVFILILVNNAKYKSLREPFLFQDYDYFLDTLRFPRLYLPFLGIKSFSIATAGCLLAILGFIWEQPPASRLDIGGQTGAALIFLFTGLILLLWGSLKHEAVSFIPEQDYHKYGFIPFLWLYALKSGKFPQEKSPYANVAIIAEKTLPTLLALQSESYFYARPLYSNINSALYKNLFKFQKEAALSGNLLVPAWGANTVRTEAAFLTGIPPENLGAHQFNPYQTMSRGWRTFSLPALLKQIGYRLICIHPYDIAFYGRKKIFPRMGFTDLIDEKEFSQDAKSGPYIGDKALGAKIVEAIEKSRQPLFIFAISMENHGPLHLEKPPAGEARQALFVQPENDFDDLAIYLKHIQNSNIMLGELFEAFTGLGPISFCFYGDHVPIIPATYQKLGYPTGVVPYFCWQNYDVGKFLQIDMSAAQLGQEWLKIAGIIQ